MAIVAIVSTWTQENVSLYRMEKNSNLSILLIATFRAWFTYCHASAVAIIWGKPNWNFGAEFIHTQPELAKKISSLPLGRHSHTVHGDSTPNVWFLALDHIYANPRGRLTNYFYKVN